MNKTVALPYEAKWILTKLVKPGASNIDAIRAIYKRTKTSWWKNKPEVRKAFIKAIIKFHQEG